MKQVCQWCKRSQTSRRNPFLFSSAPYKPEEHFQLILRKFFGSAALQVSEEQTVPIKGMAQEVERMQKENEPQHLLSKEWKIWAEGPTRVPPRQADLFKIPSACGAALFASLIPLGLEPAKSWCIWGTIWLINKYLQIFIRISASPWLGPVVSQPGHLPHCADKEQSSQESPGQPSVGRGRAFSENLETKGLSKVFKRWVFRGRSIKPLIQVTVTCALFPAHLPACTPSSGHWWWQKQSPGHQQPLTAPEHLSKRRFLLNWRLAPCGISWWDMCMMLTSETSKQRKNYSQELASIQRKPSFNRFITL